MDGEIHGGDVSALQRADELCLFFGIEAEVGIDAEDQVVMPRIAGAGEELFVARDTCVGEGIVAQPHLCDAQVGVGIEAPDEFFTLMQHVAFHIVADAIPGELIVRLHDVMPCTALDGIKVDKGFVADHAGQGEAILWGGALIIVAAAKVGIVFDGHDLLKQGQAREHRGAHPTGGGDHRLDPIWKHGGGIERQQSADGCPDDGLKDLDAKGIKQGHLAAHDIAGSDAGKVPSVAFTRAGINGGRPGGSVAAAEVVRADDKVAVRIQGLTRTHVEVPPAAVAILRPAALSAGNLRIEASCVLAAGEGVIQQDGVVFAGVQLAIRFVGDAGAGERLASGEQKGGVL